MDLWNYRALVTKVIDGDTVDAIVDAGFHATLVLRLRLLGLNAPEMHGESKLEGIASKDAVTEWLVKHQESDLPSEVKWPLLVHTEKSDVFGRYLARIVCAADGECLNDYLLENGYAVPFMV